MKTEELKAILLRNADTTGACQDGLNELKQAITKEEIANFFLMYIGFCLAKHFPDKEFLKLWFRSELEKIGVYIDRSISLSNEHNSVLLGNCFCIFTAEAFSVCRIWITGESKINIRASGNSRIMVDALNHADVVIDAKDESCIIVNLYGQATCTGATKIVQKGANYEL